MEAFSIIGGVPLSGTVTVSGAKNAALPMMAATILASEPVMLQQVPRLADVDTLALLLGYLGVEVAYHHDDGATIQTIDFSPIHAPEYLVRRMRASFCVLGPLLARRRRAVVPLPGGCRIGHRPIDLHLKGLAALGASIRIENGHVVASATRLKGARIDLLGPRGPTVTGTANVLMAACLARGDTVIENAATEPEIEDLGRLLIAMGARIEGLGTSTLRIRGVSELGGARHCIIPDRIEAGTLLIAAATTRGQITVNNVCPSHLGAVMETLESAGAVIRAEGNSVSLAMRDRPRGVNVSAQPYPGIPTDLQSQFMAMAAVAEGTSRVRDCVFPQRFHHIAELRRMGACIRRSGDAALVEGVAQLRGAAVTASDLRASAALVIAALAADGQTLVRRIDHLDRGYERLEQKLLTLGAHIERVALRGRTVAGSAQPLATLRP